ncbi:MAG: hypothetical protein K2M34_04570 [Alphaproteobacteria bacterium]|nr:hypothetical protein [Alphaproteobacteria bacterium]
MNIFIMILLAVFMMGYYMISAPSVRNTEQTTEQAVRYADLRGVAECATAVHNAKIRNTEFSDICVNQNGISSQFICLNTNMSVTDCAPRGRQKPTYSFILTATAPLDNAQYNDMMEILEQHYADAGTFGIFQQNKIVSGGTSNKRSVPKSIIDKLELTDGQLIYMTQYEIPDTGTEYTAQIAPDVVCPVGTAKTYRFGRWQCVGINNKIDCGGDMIWDSESLECVPDESRKPLCASNQTAVIVDEVWECINPFSENTCPGNMTARLNYETLEWECVSDPAAADAVKKCAHITGGAIYGRPGTTLRVPPISCTDCEKLVTDADTCVSVCVPDETKVNTPACYPGRAAECSGASRAMYFGFPSYSYGENVSAIKNLAIPLDKGHAQNRRFNCLDCGEKQIDMEKSKPPFIAVCK